MFDFRYHVTSLAAVFIALVIGILVGVAISGRSLIRDTRAASARERHRRAPTAALRRRAPGRAAERARGVRARDVPGRHGGPTRRSPRRRRVRRVGRRRGRRGDPGDDRPRRRRAGHARTPGADRDRRAAAAGRGRGRRAANRRGPRPLARARARGRRARRRSGTRSGRRSSRSARGATCRSTPSSSHAPRSRRAVRRHDSCRASTRGSPPQAFRSSASRRPTAETTAVPTYRGHGFSTVDNVDTIPGRVALAVLLTGESPGSYGTKEDNTPVLPPVEPVVPATG